MSTRLLAAVDNSDEVPERSRIVGGSKSSCKELEQAIRAETPTIERVEIRCQDANVALLEYVETADWQTTRSLVFLDPFGLEVRWSTVAKLACTGACDVWYLFPLGGVLRMAARTGHMPDHWRSRLNDLFGTSEWFSEFYSIQDSLFGDTHAERRPIRQVVNYIRRRLQSVFPAVSRAGVLENSKGFPLFALILGIANPSRNAQRLALKIGNHLIGGLSRL